MREQGVNRSRRNAIAMLGGLGAIGLYGCCCCPRRTQGLPQIDPADPGPVSDVLKPSVIQKATGLPALPKFCIDVHSHFFNATDLDVCSYIQGPVAHSVPVLGELLKLLGPIAQALAEYAPTAGQEYAELSHIMITFGSMDVATRDATMEAQIREHRKQLAKDLYDAIKGTRAEKKYLELRRAYVRATTLARGADSRLGVFQETMVEKALTLGETPSAEIPRSPDPVDHPNPDGAIAFVGYMLTRRYENLRIYMKSYSTAPNAFGIDATFGSMVDFEYWLDCPPRSTQEDSIKLHALMSLMSGGYMLPLVAYNPWTDIKEDGRSLDRVIDAVKHEGCIGVKIYPPMGYFPYGNDANQVHTSKPRPNLRELDRTLCRFFEMCIDLQVPVMGHTFETMGRDKASDVFGGPIGWGSLLTKFQKSGKSPLINLSHFGNDGPNLPAKEVWPEEFAKLMQRSNGGGVYGDLGQWSALRWCSSEAGTKDCKIAIERLCKAIAAFPMAKDRIMYGSDWLMLSREKLWADYPKQLAEAVNGALPLERFFYGNAVDCFQLGSAHPGLNRARVNDFFASHGVDLPNWFKYA